jgi:molybdate transport repressor ModE-like protein
VLSLEDASTVSELFTELASGTRCAILISLNKKTSRISSLARELEITAQDAFRNINRLLETGLVRRSGGGEAGSSAFQLTELGRLVIKQIPYFVAVNKHRKFFEDHTIKDIPDKFIQRIGALQNCEVVENVTPVFERLKKLESGAKEYLRIMISQAWPEEGKILAERAVNGVEVCVIFGRNTVFPKEVIETIIPTIDGLQKSGKIKGKMLDTINIALYLSESQSAAMFPNEKGEVDMNMLIVGGDPAFNEWCLDIFNHMWDRATIGSIDKAKIV